MALSDNVRYMPSKIWKTQGISLCQERLIKCGDVFTQKPNAFVAFLKFKYLYWTCGFEVIYLKSFIWNTNLNVYPQYHHTVNWIWDAIAKCRFSPGPEYALLLDTTSTSDGAEYQWRFESSSATSRLCDLQQICLEEEIETFERELVLPILTLETTVSPSGCEASEEQPPSPVKDAGLYPQRTCWA